MMTIVTAKMNIIMRRRLAAARGPRRGTGRVAFIINVTLLFLAGHTLHTQKKIKDRKKYHILHIYIVPSFQVNIISFTEECYLPVHLI